MIEGNQLDIGVDAHGYRPISINTVFKLFAKEARKKVGKNV